MGVEAPVPVYEPPAYIQVERLELEPGGGRIGANVACVDTNRLKYVVALEAGVVVRLLPNLPGNRQAFPVGRLDVGTAFLAVAIHPGWLLVKSGLPAGFWESNYRPPSARASLVPNSVEFSPDRPYSDVQQRLVERLQAFSRFVRDRKLARRERDLFLRFSAAAEIQRTFRGHWARDVWRPRIQRKKLLEKMREYDETAYRNFRLKNIRYDKDLAGQLKKNAYSEHKRMQMKAAMVLQRYYRGFLTRKHLKRKLKYEKERARERMEKDFRVKAVQMSVRGVLPEDRSNWPAFVEKKDPNSKIFMEQVDSTSEAYINHDKYSKQQRLLNMQRENEKLEKLKQVAASKLQAVVTGFLTRVKYRPKIKSMIRWRKSPAVQVLHSYDEDVYRLYRQQQLLRGSRVRRPTFSAPSGVYDNVDALEVILASETEECDILYTLNGENPLDTKAKGVMKYTTPLVVLAGETKFVRVGARSNKAQSTDGAKASSYFVLDSDVLHQKFEVLPRRPQYIACLTDPDDMFIRGVLEKVVDQCGAAIGGFSDTAGEGTGLEPVSGTCMHLDVGSSGSWMTKALKDSSVGAAAEIIGHLRKGHVIPPRLLAQMVAHVITTGPYKTAMTVLISGFLKSPSDWGHLQEALREKDEDRVGYVSGSTGNRFSDNGRIVNFNLPCRKLLKQPDLLAVAAESDPPEVDVDGSLEISVQIQRATLNREASGSAYVWSNNGCNTLAEIKQPDAAADCRGTRDDDGSNILATTRTVSGTHLPDWKAAMKVEVDGNLTNAPLKIFFRDTGVLGGGQLNDDPRFWVDDHILGVATLDTSAQCIVEGKDRRRHGVQGICSGEVRRFTVDIMSYLPQGSPPGEVSKLAGTVDILVRMVALPLTDAQRRYIRVQNSAMNATRLLADVAKTKTIVETISVESMITAFTSDMVEAKQTAAIVADPDGGKQFRVQLNGELYKVSWLRLATPKQASADIVVSKVMQEVGGEVELDGKYRFENPVINDVKSTNAGAMAEALQRFQLITGVVPESELVRNAKDERTKDAAAKLKELESDQSATTGNASASSSKSAQVTVCVAGINASLSKALAASSTDPLMDKVKLSLQEDIREHLDVASQAISVQSVAWQEDSSQLEIVFIIAEDASDDMTAIALADEMKEMKEVPDTAKAVMQEEDETAPALVLTVSSIA